MKFFKKFFDDDSVVVGLCKFKTINSKYTQMPALEPVFFNPLGGKYTYKTDISKNVLLL